MRTRLPLALLLAVGLAAPAAARAEKVAGVHVSKCKTGTRAKDRSATYKGWVRAVPGSERMAMRFKLVVQSPGQSSGRALSNTKLNSWHTSHAGVTKYVYSQTVRKLEPGSSYRMRVKFRWLDSSGNVIKRATHQSGSCVQDGARPNLVVSALSAFPGPAAGTAIYAVSIANRGDGPAEAFNLALFVDGGLADSRAIDRLEPGETATIDLNGPACKRVSAVVDVAETVAETAEDDNTLTSSC
jgi:CARDB